MAKLNYLGFRHGVALLGGLESGAGMMFVFEAYSCWVIVRPVRLINAARRLVDSEDYGAGLCPASDNPGVGYFRGNANTT